MEQSERALVDRSECQALILYNDTTTIAEETGKYDGEQRLCIPYTDPNTGENITIDEDTSDFISPSYNTTIRQLPPEEGGWFIWHCGPDVFVGSHSATETPCGSLELPENGEQKCKPGGLEEPCLLLLPSPPIIGPILGEEEEEPVPECEDPDNTGLPILCNILPLPPSEEENKEGEEEKEESTTENEQEVPQEKESAEEQDSQETQPSTGLTEDKEEDDQAKELPQQEEETSDDQQSITGGGGLTTTTPSEAEVEAKEESE